MYCYITISYIENGTRYYSWSGASKGVNYSTYEHFMKDLKSTLNYIDTSTSDKKFHVYINYNENGIVDYIKIVQVGAEHFDKA